MRIGILGYGMIGGTLGTLWIKAGHEVCFGSRKPEKAAALVAKLGDKARSGSPEDAATFGTIVLLATPLAATPALGQALSPLMKEKVLLDATNPYPNRDGDLAREAVATGRGSGVWTAQHFPGARVVKAFNTVYFKTLEGESHRAGERVGIPLASDDEGALKVADELVRDAGFEPVRVGPLERTREFEVGTAVYNTGMDAAKLRRALNLLP